MKSKVSSDLLQWQVMLKDELASTLTEFRDDPTIYGFALGVPDDIGCPGLMYAVGREAKLVKEKKGSSKWLDRRYSAVEWTDNWSSLNDSSDELERIYAKHRELTPPDSPDCDEEDDNYQDDCLTACLNAMLACNSEGLFGNIWYKILWMSDSEHPILGKAFRELNQGRALSEAAYLFEAE